MFMTEKVFLNVSTQVLAPVSGSVWKINSKRWVMKWLVYKSMNLHLGYLAFWLVGCFVFNGPLRQYFSLYWAVSQRGRQKREKID